MRQPQFEDMSKHPPICGPDGCECRSPLSPIVGEPPVLQLPLSRRLCKGSRARALPPHCRHGVPASETDQFLPRFLQSTSRLPHLGRRDHPTGWSGTPPQSNEIPCTVFSVGLRDTAIPSSLSKSDNVERGQGRRIPDRGPNNYHESAGRAQLPDAPFIKGRLLCTGQGTRSLAMAMDAAPLRTSGVRSRMVRRWRFGAAQSRQADACTAAP